MAKQKTGRQKGRWFAAIIATLKLLTRKETPWLAKLALITAAVYLISPYDLLPDWLLGLGIIDDFVVVSLLIWLARRLAGQVDDSA